MDGIFAFFFSCFVEVFVLWVVLGGGFLGGWGR